MTTILTLIFSILLHPVHLSITNIDYNNSEKCFDISIRIFIDDFEMILENYYNEKINIGKENENPDTDKYIRDYIVKNLVLEIDNQEIKNKNYLFIGRKIEDITLWLYFKIKYKEKLNYVTITNSILTDLYKDQKNLLIFTYNEIPKAEEFSCKETKKTFEF